MKNHQAVDFPILNVNAYIAVQHIVIAELNTVKSLPFCEAEACKVFAQYLIVQFIYYY